MNKKSLIAVILLVAAISGIIFLNFGLSKTKSYYSGDAIEYDGQLIIGTANTGYLEIFKFQNGKLINLAKVQAPVDGQMRSDTYNDVLFNIEADRLYVYASSGRTLYKYDFSGLDSLGLVNSSTDTSFDWLGHLTKNNGRIVTSGSKAVKIWTTDLQVVDSFKVVNSTNPYNVSLDAKDRFIFNINGSNLEVYDRDFRQLTHTLSLNVNTLTGNKQAYFDAPANMLYVVDDVSLRKMDLDGNVYKSIQHPSQFSYDVAGSLADNNYIYSSNGRGVAKYNKKDFKLMAHFKSYKFSAPNSWAMGLRVVSTKKGEAVVVFNNSNIVVLDKNLKPFAVVLATEEDLRPQPVESLSLKVDRNNGVVGSEVALSGAGWQPDEPMSVFFDASEYKVRADNNGRFALTLVVPFSAEKKSGVDIKAVGQKSGLSYSLGFRIVK